MIYWKWVRGSEPRVDDFWQWVHGSEPRVAVR
jgi:hypothetical protein